MAALPLCQIKAEIKNSDMVAGKSEGIRICPRPRKMPSTPAVQEPTLPHP
jgi:hypothetical protein